MASTPPRIAAAAWRVIPAGMRVKLRGETGKRFARFVLVAVAAVIASQVALILFLDEARMTAGLSGGLAAVVGAAVSYVLSRWAWERKGRPHVLKETLPFWIVSVAAWVVLGLATKLGVHLAAGLPHGGLRWHLIVNGTYFGANVLTFLARFAIFHYWLFADRGAVAGGADAAVPASAPEALSETLDAAGDEETLDAAVVDGETLGAAAGDETSAGAGTTAPRSPR